MSMRSIGSLVCRVSKTLQTQGRIPTRSGRLASAAALLLLPLLASAVATTTPTLDQVRKSMAGLAVPFEANEGHFAPEVAFAARTFAGTLFVTRDGKIVHALAGKSEQKKEAKPGKYARENDGSATVNYPRDERTAKNQTPRGPGWTLVESMQGAGELAPTGSHPSATNVSRFQGGAIPNQTWNIATFDRVSLGEAWPGVAVELAARGSNVEKLFTVAPGTSPKTIRMHVAGAKRLRLGEGGNLIATTGNGDVAFTPPVAFQELGAKRTAVSVRYVLAGASGYGFEITGAFDRSQPLVIDPLLQSTYLGGSGRDVASSLAIDAGGNVFVAGYTLSTSFPGTAGGAQPAHGGGNYDAFVARLSSNLQTLVQVTYLGGSGYDQAYALALDASGNVFVAGETTSNFPGTSGGAQPANGGASLDSFIARLSNNLTTLVQATYLGGSGTADFASALALDAAGNVFVAGYTNSTNFPGTAGGAQPASGGGGDPFIARLSGGLTTLMQATYLGGSSGDQAYALVLDAGGEVFVAGSTSSTDFPGTSSGAQPTNGGLFDAFVARLSGNLTTLVGATYLCGNSQEGPNALTLDAGGNVLIAGFTDSPNFPGTTGGAQPAYGGGQDDAFVARLSNNLTMLMQSTYLGGSGFDDAYALARDASGNVFVAGVNHSFDFPGTSGGAQPIYGGGFEDAFILRLSNNLTTVIQSTYLGGNDEERTYAMALDAGGNVLVAGYTLSTDFPGTAGGAQPARGGGSDAYVAKLTPDPKGPIDTIFANGFE